MTASCATSRRRPRAGFALIWALIILVILGATSAAATWHIVAARRALEGRQNQLQALWLARAGVELATARLLAEPDGYTGEVVTPVPESEVRITVQKDPAAPDKYQVRSEARYPVDDPRSAVHSLSRIATRRKDGTDVRIELIDPGDGEGETGAGNPGQGP